MARTRSQLLSAPASSLRGALDCSPNAPVFLWELDEGGSQQVRRQGGQHVLRRSHFELGGVAGCQGRQGYDQKEK